jgi:phage tail protein X
MREPETAELKSSLHQGRWSFRDGAAAAVLFLVSAAVVLWQNAHLAVLWDASYTLDTSVRIALGQMPYRDFPLVHTPLTFLIQAAIMRLTGRVFFHHVLYAAIAGGLGTVLAWRIVLGTLRGRLPGAWAVSFLLAAPLTVLGIYSILPFPSYDCDTVFFILLVVLLLQRLPVDSAAQQPSGTRALLRPFIAGAALPLPLFFKQNIGLPFLLAALALILLLLIAKKLRCRLVLQDNPGVAALGAMLAGAAAMLLAAGLLLHFTAGVGNCIHWTIQFAGERRLPGFQTMLAIYAEPSLLWWIPCVAAALVLLHSRLAKALWARLVALGLLAAPFVWTLAGLFLSSDAEDRATDLIVLWPLLLVLSGALTLWNLCREWSVRALLPVLLLVAINGTLLSQQLWGSTYAIWPLLVILIAEMIVFLVSIEPAQTGAETAPLGLFVAPALAAVIAATFAVCGGLYTFSEERLDYVQLPEGPVVHATAPALRGMADPGPFLPDFEELLRFAANEIPVSDGLILIPGEDPFYFATGRVPQFPVLLFDRSTDPLSPEQLIAEARKRNIRWLIVKRNLQIKEDVTPQREETLKALQQVFLPYRKLGSYDVYRRP